MKRRLILSIAVLLSLTASCAFASNENQKFQQYISDLKHHAKKAGVSEKTVNKYLSDLKAPKEKVQKSAIYKKKHEAAAIDPFKQYKAEFINKTDVKGGKKRYQRYLPLLKKVEKVYHVQPRFIVALWGIESDYGRDTGNYPLIKSLVTLGYQHHRSKFYRRQIVDALVMLDQPKVIPEQLKSAWDGGMGQPQFEPASYLSYGVDFNKDGFVNIWTNLPDVFASIANFLHKNGWNGKQTWGIEVKVPKNFPVRKSGYPLKHSIEYWRKLGVTQLDGKPLEDIKGKTALLLPDGIKGDAFIIYPNFKVFMRWNDVIFEGLCAGLLSDDVTTHS